MNYIELIGPPGAGKTTLLQALLTTRNDHPSWKTYEEAIFEIIDALSWRQLNSNKSKLLYLVNKINLSGYKKLGICNTLIKELAPQIADTIPKKYEYLVEAQLKAIQSLPSVFSPINKCSFISWYLQTLKKLFILETFGYRQTVIFTEGPLKNHHGLDYIDPNAITPGTLPSAIIFCTVSVSKNVERIQNRVALTGNISTIHNSLNDDNLEQLVSYTHQIANDNLAFIKMIGIPTYEIDITDHITDGTLYTLNQFITTNSANKINYQINYATI